MQSTKLIIDKHFESNYSYYKQVCYNYCKGGECHKDLLHKCYEEFLNVKDEVIIKFNELNRLYNIGLRIIKSLYYKRFRVKKHKANTSDLFDLSLSVSGVDIDSIYSNDNLMNSVESTHQVCYSESDYLTLDKAINELLSDSVKSTSIMIFLQANESSINKLSEESRISRFYLTKEYNKGKEYLKQYIQNESRSN